MKIFRLFPFVLAAFILAPLTPVFAAEVAIEGYGFSPQTIEISPGEAVTWKNTGTTMHTITSGENCSKDGAWSSSYLFIYSKKPEKAVYTHVFEKPGIYHYFCKPHCKQEGMTGMVIVK